MKKVITFIIVALVIIVGLTAYLNKGNVEEKEIIQKEAKLIIKNQGEEVAIADFDTIKSLGEVTFKANLDSSGKPPEEHTYTGVLLNKLLNNYGVELNENSQVIVTAIDGYVVAYSGKEVMEDDNIYLVYKRDDEYIKSREEGGSGPYQVVVKNDQFGQYWCKYVTEIEVK